MNTQSTAIPESRIASQVSASVAPDPMRLLFWSVRRELWENRALYIAPLAVAVLFLAGFLVSLVRYPAKMRAIQALAPMQQRDAIAQPYEFAAMLMMGVLFVIAIFYSIDAFQGERRDRSILFWKSMPVSDLTTVLSKAAIPIVVVPALTFVFTIAMQWIMLMFSSLVLLTSGISPSTLWTQLQWIPMSFMLLYHLVTGHMLWYAPIYCWLLLVSAWARRAAILWAFVPMMAIGVIEKLVFNTSYFGGFVENRVAGGADIVESSVRGLAQLSPMTHITPGRFLENPGLWGGLLFGGLFLAAAARIRRYRGPM